ncbi:hypothetical protein SBDP1_480012 [Syntrophobacter sp. SbD1]|nr:hypothetical protein SBDP1_480012 [Syntrophobacter sp. SbD1]
MIRNSSPPEKIGTTGATLQKLALLFKKFLSSKKAILLNGKKSKKLKQSSFSLPPLTNNTFVAGKNL